MLFICRDDAYIDTLRCAQHDPADSTNIHGLCLDPVYVCGSSSGHARVQSDHALSLIG